MILLVKKIVTLKRNTRKKMQGKIILKVLEKLSISATITFLKLTINEKVDFKVFLHLLN